MNLLRQIGSYAGLVVVIILLWIGVTYFPKFKRVMPDTNFRDLVLIPTDATVPVDPTIPISQMRDGDVLCYRVPEEMKYGFGYLVAKPGEKVGIVDRKLVVDGRVIDFGTVLSLAPDREAVVVPADHVWVVSDSNRFDSFALGPIPRTALVGVVGNL